MGPIKWLKFLIKNVLYAMKENVFMLLDNVVFSVFVKTVIKKEVILIYQNVLFVEHNYNCSNLNIITSVVVIDQYSLITRIRIRIIVYL